ncbi:MAG: SLBB domain-containing protein [bacterium]|nr:SLBB domain-containing protein [bacterium]
MNLKLLKAFTLIFLSIPAIIFSQVDRQKVGNDMLTSQQGGFYNYGDKDKVNIEVNVWGYVKFPGKYLIPKGSTIMDLISYSGGPLTETKLEDIRLFRPKNDSLRITEDRVIELNYNDLFWEERVSSKSKYNSEMIPGDILILTGEPRYFARDNVNFILSISAVLISIGILLVSIVKK